MDKKFYTIKEAAQFLNVSEQSLYDYRCAGKGPKHYKPAGRIYYFEEDLIDWIKTNGEQWKPVGLVAGAIVKEASNED